MAGFEVSTEAEFDHVSADEQIAFVLDRNDMVKSRATYLYGRLLEEPHVRYRSRLGGITFVDSKRVKPLQLADILAHVSLRYLDDTLLGGKPMGWQMKALQPLMVGRWFTEESLSRLMPILEEQHRARGDTPSPPERPVRKPSRWRLWLLRLRGFPKTLGRRLWRLFKWH